MQAVDLIAAGGVIASPPSDSFESAVRLLTHALIANGQLATDVGEPAVRAVCEREAVGSTAIVEIGVAVPHARVEGVDGVVAALATSPTAVYYPITGVPISIMVMVLSAPDRVEDHLNALAGVSLLLQSASLRRALQRAGDAATALRVLRRGSA
ncbi:MAG: PTS sugar transporter subunit IIA [Candidatus Binatia bacterium]